MGTDYTVYVRGLEMAIEEIQRLHDRAISGNYKEAYVFAMDEALIYLKAMKLRAERGEYPHPVAQCM